MVCGRLDFYLDVYHSDQGQIEIMQIALEQDASLRAHLVAILQNGAEAQNQWERNLALLLGQSGLMAIETEDCRD